jgi:hypothetical protein
MDEWLTRARDTLAETADIPASDLEITDAAATTLLKLAALAAHESGERTNAPLLCYLIGRADQGGELEKLSNAIETRI